MIICIKCPGILWFLRSAEPGGCALALLLIFRLFDINPLFYLKSVLMKRVYPLLFTVALLTVILPLITEAQCTCTGGIPATPVDYYASFGPTNTSSTSVSFPQFNPAIGTLACLKLKDSISGISSTHVTNTGPDSTQFEFLLTVSNDIKGPAGGGYQHPAALQPDLRAGQPRAFRHTRRYHHLWAG